MEESRVESLRSNKLTIEISQSLGGYVATNVRPKFPPLESGLGVFVWDITGKKYLDMSSQTLNLSLGHRHPAVEGRVRQQLERIWFASGRFQTDVHLKLAKKLVEVSPSNLSHVNLKLTNGSDAVETALKVMRKYSWEKHRRGSKVLVMEGAWHGESSEVLSAMPTNVGKHYLGGSGCFIVTKRHDCFHCQFGQKAENCNLECAVYVEQLIKQNVPDLAGGLIEPIQISGGLNYHPARTPEFLNRLHSVCATLDIPITYDEVQTYGGWLDGKLFGTDYLNLTPPNLICLAKALGQGLPIAAVLMESKFENTLAYNEAEFTGGGQGLACAAGLAALDILTSKDFMVRKKAEAMRSLLLEIQQEFAPLVNICSVGLIGHVEFMHTTPQRAMAMATYTYQRCLERGVIFRLALRAGVMLIKPPIVIDLEQINYAMSTLRAVIHEICAQM